MATRKPPEPLSGQAQLPFPKRRGGRREGAGRPPRPTWVPRLVPHASRPLHKSAHPVHLTLRARRDVGAFFRTQLLFPIVERAIRATNCVDGGSAFRIVHFSVQTNHVHLIIEANDKVAMRRGAAGLSVRAARAINRAMGRRGSIWADRYHTLTMTTPRHVRNTIVYVLFNIKKHQPGAAGLDACSSAPWFDGFAKAVSARDGPPRDRAAPSPARVRSSNRRSCAPEAGSSLSAGDDTGSSAQDETPAT